MFKPILDVFTVLLPNIDVSVAWWFHQHLTHATSGVLMLMSNPGSPEYVGSITASTALLLCWRRLWHHLMALGIAVPGGMLANQVLKVTIQRPRPFPTSPYIDVTGYSFPSGHTMAAALLYGVLALFVISMIQSRHFRLLAVFTASLLVLIVAFSRVALGAHYVTDVLAAIIASLGWLGLSLGAVGRIMPRPCMVTGFPGRSENKPAPTAAS